MDEMNLHTDSVRVRLCRNELASLLSSSQMSAWSPRQSPTTTKQCVSTAKLMWRIPASILPMWQDGHRIQRDD
eukprot:CAMPEP_0182846064 /NCGR_PEP_ID=MMETSP0006_2-20121128/27682_1 /TAXON_ID=97485 /ORGANISM="Prymnesium parvum, Strain Texoma1" /LENGTH=72 /DNA_ID=CAMNT_0024976219 /DNA_START=339 /DNA_END=557 /DNA_ORIENTATION=-